MALNLFLPLSFQFLTNLSRFQAYSEKMLIPTADRRKIYEKFFEDGVAIAKKDYTLKSHPEIEGVKNIYVIKALTVGCFVKGFLLASITKPVIKILRIHEV